MSNLTRSEIYTVVNRYIGVSGGYLGDFSYRTHAEFYLEYCDLDINPYEYQGTTRERFIKILGQSNPRVQAIILREVLKKYPPSSSPLRTKERYDEIQRMIARLEGASPVSSPAPQITSAVVERAICDAETLLRNSGATSGVDRIHTALRGFLKTVCDSAGISYSSDPSLTELYKLLRQNHPALKDLGTHHQHIDKILKAFSAVLDSLNTLRNIGSVAHPTQNLLDQEEALLSINAARTILHYLDAKLSK
jgi:hypothetical protein